MKEGAIQIETQSSSDDWARRLKTRQHILEYVRHRAQDDEAINRMGWERTYRELSEDNEPQALPFLEAEVIAAHNPKRTDLYNLREIIFLIGTKTDLGKKEFLPIRTVELALESYRDQHLHELQSQQAQADEIKEVRSEWNEDISDLRRGITEPALRRAEMHVFELDERIGDTRSRGKQITGELYSSLNDARAVRTTLLKKYFELPK